MPAFTLAEKGDKYSINRARFNLYSLLIPVHNRRKAMGEFKEAALEWRNLSKKGKVDSINDFYSVNILRQGVEKCVEEYTR